MENYLWQYIVVAVIILLALGRMVWGMTRKKNKKGSCCGCSLAQTCHDFKKTSPNAEKEEPKGCHQ
ncbi:MAG: hypothetical protein K2M88_08465 [Muribaculaceae bacterium]|nr:hypothetical protein [Muribaculaceae bacterium]